MLRHVGEMFMLRSNQTPRTNLPKAHLAKKKSLAVANLHCTQFFEVLPKENKSVCWQSFSCDSKGQMVDGLRDGQMISNGLCPDAITMFTPTHRINRHLASASASKSANFDPASTFTTERDSYKPDDLCNLSVIWPLSYQPPAFPRIIPHIHPVRVYHLREANPSSYNADEDSLESSMDLPRKKCTGLSVVGDIRFLSYHPFIYFPSSFPPGLTQWWCTLDW